MNNDYEKMIEAITSNVEFNSFRYLQVANRLLSNPAQQNKGRELIIRALDRKSNFHSHFEILRAMVRKSGLYPYLFSEFSDLSFSDKLATEVYKSPHSEGFIFHAMQLRIYNLIVSKKNVVLSAPTSMGKSAIIDSLIASGEFNNIVIVVPTIALIDETRRRISKLFSDCFQIIYHSAQKSKAGRKIFILTQERVNERDDFDNIDIFIIDEFYKLAFKAKKDKIDYDERVISLNVALSKLLSISKQFYMIGPNIDFIRGLGRLKNDYVFLSSNFNTVALNVFEYKVRPNDIIEKDRLVNGIIKMNDGQFIIYCKSPKSAEHISNELINGGISFGSDESEYTDWLSKYYSPHWQYIKSIRNGLGLHYGTLPRAIQQYTIELFNSKKIKVLICTSTIIEGVNTNAQHVIIYDNRDGNSSIDKFTHNNIKGRAGRMRQYFVGNVHCLEVPPESSARDSIVDIPIGLQDELTPLNLIAGIESEHVDERSEYRLGEYLNETKLPLDIIKKHSSYPVEIINDLFMALMDLSEIELSAMCFKRYPDKRAMSIISLGLQKTSFNSLRRNGISIEIDSISGLLYSYLNASSHQDYFDSQLKRIFDIHQNQEDEVISEGINRELKIIRNIFSYTVPKSLALQQDIVNYIIKTKYLTLSADYSFIINTFEKYHLPGNVSALEEMGIPIQSLQKIHFPVDFVLDVDKLLVYIKSTYMNNSMLSNIEKKLIQRALVV